MRDAGCGLRVAGCGLRNDRPCHPDSSFPVILSEAKDLHLSFAGEISALGPGVTDCTDNTDDASGRAATSFASLTTVSGEGADPSRALGMTAVPRHRIPRPANYDVPHPRAGRVAFRAAYQRHGNVEQRDADREDEIQEVLNSTVAPGGIETYGAEEIVPRRMCRRGGTRRRATPRG